jgi:hypothetical protein
MRKSGIPVRVYFELDLINGTLPGLREEFDSGFELGQRFSFSADAVITKKEVELLELSRGREPGVEPVTGVAEVTIRLLNPKLTTKEAG